MPLVVPPHPVLGQVRRRRPLPAAPCRHGGERGVVDVGTHLRLDVGVNPNLNFKKPLISGGFQISNLKVLEVSEFQTLHV